MDSRSCNPVIDKAEFPSGEPDGVTQVPPEEYRRHLRQALQASATRPVMAMMAACVEQSSPNMQLTNRLVSSFRLGAALSLDAATSISSHSGEANFSNRASVTSCFDIVPSKSQRITVWSTFIS